MNRYIKSHSNRNLRVKVVIADSNSFWLKLQKRLFLFFWYQVKCRSINVDSDIRMECMEMIDKYQNKYKKIKEVLKNLEP